MSKVQCNGCNACCHKQIVALMPEDDANLEHYDYREIVDGGEILRVLRNNPDGSCVHLSADGCSIYEHRPAICREYDCRKQFMIMSRTERRMQGKAIWPEARKRLNTLDDGDKMELAGYRGRAETAPVRAVRKV